ncbi:MAG TPA: choice-of-anchor Q domain-containing protein [Verrucomicrobiae bacterium]|nr:choice-of-anchor Q domain-containing protein [Verrucomicrobiae bacterium]
MKNINPLPRAILPSGAARIRVLCMLSMTCTLKAWSQYSLDSFGISPGGDSTGGDYSLTATIGEIESAATVSGGPYSLETGFWAITAVPTPNAPSLSIQSTPTNTVIVSWPVSAEGFDLRQNPNLNTADWTVPPQPVNTAGGNRFIVVNPPSGNLFYRLTKVSAGHPFQVVNLNDSGLGSLRTAIQSATNNATVTFAAGLEGVITLNSELAINKSITIAGPGPTVIALSGASTNRVFNVSTGNVRIAGLTIRDGLARVAISGEDGVGGGILNRASLVLSNCAVVANLAAGTNGANGINANGAAGSSGSGGGIYNAGTLVMVNCTLALNSARGGHGGRGADRLTANNGYAGGAAGHGLGAAVCNDGILNATNCTFAVNQAHGGNGGNGGEGGLLQGVGGTGGNAEGGAVLNRQSAQFASVTIHGNATQRGTGGTGLVTASPGIARGGGIRTTTGSVSLVNTLVAQNALGAGGQAPNGPDVFGSLVSQGYNLVSVTNGSGVWMASDLVGNDLSPLNAMVGSPQDNGGAIPTMALLSGSPAIDQGKAIGLTTDQRGLPRPIDLLGVTNAPGGDSSDIGAFESTQ